MRVILSLVIILWLASWLLIILILMRILLLHVRRLRLEIRMGQEILPRLWDN